MSSEGREESGDRMFSDAVPEFVKMGWGKSEYTYPGKHCFRCRILSRSAEYEIGTIQTRLRFKSPLHKENVTIV
jgi:hypothetical protein